MAAHARFAALKAAEDASAASLRSRAPALIMDVMNETMVTGTSPTHKAATRYERRCATARAAALVVKEPMPKCKAATLVTMYMYALVGPSQLSPGL